MNTIVSEKLFPLLREPIDVKLTSALPTGAVSRQYRVKLETVLADRTIRNDYIMLVPARDFNYFCYNKQNRITCWPMAQGVQPLNEKGQWKAEGRTEIKPGKFLLLFDKFLQIREIATGNLVLTDLERIKVINRACEIFTDRVRGMNEALEYDITHEISRVYKLPTHEMSGSLRNSCMRPNSGHGCPPYSGFYDYIPNLSILYKEVDGQLLFRALLWENLKLNNNGTTTFLDRVYASEPLQHRLVAMAMENGWAYRHFSDSRVMLNDGRNHRLSCEIPQESAFYLQREGSPYIDTMCVLSRDRKTGALTLNNYLESERGYEVKYVQSSSGSIIRIFESCCYCDKILTSNTRRNVGGMIMCSTCLPKHTAHCERCGVLTLTDKVIRCSDLRQTVCQSCASELHISFCNYCRSFRVNTTYDDDTGKRYCRECEGNFPVCRYCGVKHHPEKLSSYWIDYHVSPRICQKCKKLFYRCEICGNLHSGILPLSSKYYRYDPRAVLCPSNDCREVVKKYRAREERMYRKEHGLPEPATMIKATAKRRGSRRKAPVQLEFEYWKEVVCHEC